MPNGNVFEYDGADELARRCYESAREKYGETLPDEAAKRLETELDIIRERNAAGTFALGEKVAVLNSEKGWCFGTRGAVGSSFAAYLLGITKVNPLPPHYYCSCCKKIAFVGEKRESGFDLESASFGLQKFTYEILQTGAIGVDIFVLITGFFGYKSGSNPKKIISLLLEVEFYSILVGVCMILTGDEELSASYVLHTLFPTTFKQYWFFTAYIVLMLLSPYINKFIAAVSRADHLKLILEFIRDAHEIVCRSCLLCR